MNFCASVVPSYIFLNFYFEFTCTLICINNFVSASVLKLPDFCTVHICFNYIDCCNCCLCVCACVPDCSVCACVYLCCLISSPASNRLEKRFFLYHFSPEKPTHTHSQSAEMHLKGPFSAERVCVCACVWVGGSQCVCVCVPLHLFIRLSHPPQFANWERWEILAIRANW